MDLSRDEQSKQNSRDSVIAISAVNIEKELNVVNPYYFMNIFFPLMIYSPLDGRVTRCPARL